MTALAAMMGPADRLDWETPKDILDLITAFNGGSPIGLDPCATFGGRNGCKARTWFTETDNGLIQPWAGYGLVYANPPYGSALVPWCEKAATEGAKGVEILLLLPARTDTRWWHDYVATATAVCFFKGRLTFVGAPAAAPFPSALAYWGPLERGFRKAFGPRGWIP